MNGGSVIIAHAPLFAVAVIFLLGLSILFFKRNLIKILMGITLIEAAINLFLVSTGYRMDAIAPIFTNAPEGAVMALPTVQALTLTSIVIGVASSAMMLSFVMLIYRHYKTTNVNRIRGMKG